MGELSRRDVVETAAAKGDPLNKVILAFNINISKDAQAELENQDVKIFSDPVVYRLIEEYQEWLDGTKKQTDADKRSEFPFPAKFKIMPNCVFRASKPAIVGIRILAGRARANLKLIDGLGAKTVLRCPLIPEKNLRNEHLEGIARLVLELKNVTEINIMAYHTLGSSKYEALNMEDEMRGATAMQETEKEEAIAVLNRYLSQNGKHVPVK